jgi:hypothetical protein
MVAVSHYTDLNTKILEPKHPQISVPFVNPLKQTHDMQGLQMSYFNRNIHNNEINNCSK